MRACASLSFGFADRDPERRRVNAEQRGARHHRLIFAYQDLSEPRVPEISALIGILSALISAFSVVTKRPPCRYTSRPTSAAASGGSTSRNTRRRVAGSALRGPRLPWRAAHDVLFLVKVKDGSGRGEIVANRLQYAGGQGSLLGSRLRKACARILTATCFILARGRVAPGEEKAGKRGGPSGRRDARPVPSRSTGRSVWRG